MPFEPGNSANPGGRPKKSNKAAGMCREQTDRAIATLIAKLDSEKEDIQLKAAVEILNRGWGKPQEFIEHSTDPDNPPEIHHNIAQKLLAYMPTETLQKFVDESVELTDHD